MRLFTTSVCLLLLILSNAQNWALINPAYKYNYSNDGTDTISNQLFVTHVDTLGVDSFRYELNRVAMQCDTCTSAYMTSYFWSDAPQWVGGDVLINNDLWHFTTGTSHLILPLAELGNTWLYDTLSNVWAEMGPTTDTVTFELPDQHRIIFLDNGGQLVLSREYGILIWDDGHQLIGINGPQLGHTTPTLAEFFPYVAGDVLEYEKGYGGCDGVFGCDGYSKTFKFTVQERTDTDSSVFFTGLMVAHEHSYTSPATPGNPGQDMHYYQNSSGEWIAGIPEYPWSEILMTELPWTELLFSYPGQLVIRQSFMDPYYTYANTCIAEHSLDSTGRYVISCRPFALDQPDYVGHFFHQHWQPGSNLYNGPEDFCDIAFASDYPCGIDYVEGLGMIGFGGNYFERGEQYWLRGMILNGDTVIGSITSNSILLGISDNSIRSTFTVSPNPANEHLVVKNLPLPSEDLMIYDTSGRTCRTISAMGQERMNINVSDLSPGLYFLQAGSNSIPQRFIIAR